MDTEKWFKEMVKKYENDPDYWVECIKLLEGELKDLKKKFKELAKKNEK